MYKHSKCQPNNDFKILLELEVVHRVMVASCDRRVMSVSMGGWWCI